MRKIALLISFSLVFGLSPLVFASGEGSITSMIEGEGFGGDVAPIFELRANDKSANYNAETETYEFDYAPGAKFSDMFYLSNLTSDQTLNLSFLTQDAYTDSLGQVSYSADTQYHIGKWTTVPKSVDLAASAVQELPFEINLPNVASPTNDFSGAIYVKIQNSSDTSKFAVKIKIKSTSTEAAAGQFKSEFTRKSDGETYSEFNLKLTNAGNTFLRGSHKLASGTNVIDDLALGLMPGETLEKIIKLEKSFGSYRIFSKFENVNGELTESLVGTYFLFPHIYFYLFIFLLLVGVGVGGFFIYRWNPKYAIIYGVSILLISLVLIYFYYPRENAAADDNSVLLSQLDSKRGSNLRVPAQYSLNGFEQYFFTDVLLQNTELIRDEDFVSTSKSEDFSLGDSQEIICEDLPDPIVSSEPTIQADSSFKTLDCGTDAAFTVSSDFQPDSLSLSEVFLAGPAGARFISGVEIANNSEKAIPLTDYAFQIGTKQMNFSGAIAAKQRKLLYLNRKLGSVAFGMSFLYKSAVLGTFTYDPKNVMYANTIYSSVAKLGEVAAKNLIRSQSVATNDTQGAGEWIFSIHSTPFKDNIFANTRPKASFQLLSSEETPDGLKLSFTAAASSDIDGDSLKFKWFFSNHQQGLNETLSGEVVDVFVKNNKNISIELTVSDVFGGVDVMKTQFNLDREFDFSDTALFTLYDNFNTAPASNYAHGKIRFDDVSSGETKTAYLDNLSDVAATKIYFTLGAFEGEDSQILIPASSVLILNGLRVEGGSVTGATIFDITEIVQEMRKLEIENISPILQVKFPDEVSEGYYSASVTYTYY